MNGEDQSEKLRELADTSPRSGRQPAPPTFAEAMVQLQAAHFREVDSLKRELLKMSRKVTKLATKQAQLEEESARGAAGARASKGSDEVAILGRPAPKPIDAWPAPEPTGLAANLEAVESLPGKQGSDKVFDIEQACDSDSTSDDPSTVRERRDTTDSDGILWNPFADGQSGLSKYMSGFVTGGQSRKKRRAYKIVKSLPFETVSYVAIIANSVFIGISMQIRMDRVQDSAPDEKWPDAVEFCFGVFFTIELLGKVLAEDVYFFFGGDWHWNTLDLVLVSASLLQLTFDAALGSESPNLSISRTIRLFRVARVLRVVKVVQVCQSLRVMIFSIFKSLDVLGWVLVVLLFFKYIFAMIFMHGTISYFELYLDDGGDALSLEEQQFWDDSQAHIDYMKCSWSTVYRALLTLFESITGGRDWGEVFYSLEKVSPVYGICFLVYIYFMVFLVLNVVIGSVVDVTSSVAARDRDRMVDDEMKNLKDYAENIKAFFVQADSDGSGQLSWEEFKSHLEDNRVKAYFQTLDLDIRKAHSLFKLLDHNGSGGVGIDEFLDGCLRLRGQAKSLDINLVIYQLELLTKGLSWMTHAPARPLAAASL